MATVFIRHQVKDFGAWKQAYDAFRPRQQALGVQGDAVYQAAADPNDVTVTHSFASLEAAERFMGNDELRQTMSKAGVAGEPTVWFTNEA